MRNFFADLLSGLESDTRLLIPGFGVFEVRVGGRRRVLNPITKEPMELPPTEEVRFRAAGEVKARLNTPMRARRREVLP